MRFHERAGSSISLHEGYTSAQRLNAFQEFNNGLVLSQEPLPDNYLFEVRLDKKVRSWSGSLEIGVTTLCPDSISFPSSATDLLQGTWLMTGASIVKNGMAIIEKYGRNLDTLEEGDSAGVMRKSNGFLHFFVNGVDQGIAGIDIPPGCFVVVNLYGKCAAISILKNVLQAAVIDDGVAAACASSLCQSFSNSDEFDYEDTVTFPSDSIVSTPLDSSSYRQSSSEACSTLRGYNEANAEGVDNDLLCFHERCGDLIKLSNGCRAAERSRPLDEFNNGLVITNRPLRDDEMFEIRIDALVYKWSGSVELGITTLNPNTADLPVNAATLPNGSVIMSGRSILCNGVTARREYGECNLNDLTEGDRVGVKRKANGDVHFYVNGIDQGCAKATVSGLIFGVVDLYGMACKVSITDFSGMPPSLYVCRLFETVEDISCSQDNTAGEADTLSLLKDQERRSDWYSRHPTLKFHSVCGRNAQILQNGTAAARVDASSDFENAVVFTNRPLEVDELFVIKIDETTDKWTGSVGIGVAKYCPETVDDVPVNLSNLSADYWLWSGQTITHNGLTICESYGASSSISFQRGDRIGVVIRSDGTLHFMAHEVDLGIAADFMPTDVYGFVDVYGEVSQISISLHDDSSWRSTVDVEQLQGTENLSHRTENVISFPSHSHMRFYGRHGSNVILSNDGIVASRRDPLTEFNNAIVIGGRCLAVDELLEIKLEGVTDQWFGSIAAGITSLTPDNMQFPDTLVELSACSWVLSGSTVIHNRVTVNDSYALDLNTLETGDKLAFKLDSAGRVNFFLNGVDKGVAFSNVTESIYPVIDVYGRCLEISITSNENFNKSNTCADQSVTLTTPADGATNCGKLSGSDVIDLASDPGVGDAVVSYDSDFILTEFATVVDGCVTLENENRLAKRTGFSRAHGGAIVRCCAPISAVDTFEIKIEAFNGSTSESLHIGLCPEEALFPFSSNSFKNWQDIVRRLNPFLWFSGSSIYENCKLLASNYCPSLSLCPVGTSLALALHKDGSIELVINGHSFGPVPANISGKMFVFIHLYGRCDVISATGTLQSVKSYLTATSSHLSALPDHTWRFSDICGTNVTLDRTRRTAVRSSTKFDHGLLFSSDLLYPNILYQIRIDKLSIEKFKGTLAVGVVFRSPQEMSVLPNSILNLRDSASCFLMDNVVIRNYVKTCLYGLQLLHIKEKDIIGLSYSDCGTLRFFLNGKDMGVAAEKISSNCHVVIDLYGSCKEISVVLLPDVDGCTKYSEKADLELIGDREAVVFTDMTWSFQSLNCPYIVNCQMFLRLFNVYGQLDCGKVSCFCANCRCVNSRYNKGVQANDWCRFGTSSNEPVSASIHLAYMGVKMSSLWPMLELSKKSCFTDSVLAKTRSSGQMKKDGSCVNRPVHPLAVNSDTDRHCIMSPSVTCASLDCFAPFMCFSDKKHHIQRKVKAVLEVSVPVTSVVKVLSLTSPDLLQRVRSCPTSSRKLLSLGSNKRCSGDNFFWLVKDRDFVVNAILLKL